MNLQEQINRVKSLMGNTFSKIFYKTVGDANKFPGIKIVIGNDDFEMGHIYLLNLHDASKNDCDIPRFYNGKESYCRTNCEDNFFNNDNTLYLYDLQIYDDFKGKGLSNGLMDYSHNIATDSGKKYVLLITNRNNTIAQNLYKKHGYKLHQTDEIKDFYFLKL